MPAGREGEAAVTEQEGSREGTQSMRSHPGTEWLTASPCSLGTACVPCPGALGEWQQTVCPCGKPQQTVFLPHWTAVGDRSLWGLGFPTTKGSCIKGINRGPTFHTGADPTESPRATAAVLLVVIGVPQLPGHGAVGEPHLDVGQVAPV